MCCARLSLLHDLVQQLSWPYACTLDIVQHGKRRVSLFVWLASPRPKRVPGRAKVTLAVGGCALAHGYDALVRADPEALITPLKVCRGS